MIETVPDKDMAKSKLRIEQQYETPLFRGEFLSEYDRKQEKHADGDRAAADKLGESMVLCADACII